jgi:Ni,Fe-hydrogenase III small subunit/ferredoxin
MFNSYKIFRKQGKQYIPDLTSVQLPSSFLGKPEIDSKACKNGCGACEESCPTHAIRLNPLTLDLGKCIFCSECTRVCPEGKITFTNDYKMATNDRNLLIVKEGDKRSISFNPEIIRKEIIRYFSGSLKLRQVSAAGDSSAEWELNAVSNVNFDLGRYGIEFVASPRHADGIVITGPISDNMSEALQICYDAMPSPKIVILVGADAISGGIFVGSPALNRSFLSNYKVDLYVPGNPPHPLTFINGILELIKKRK